MNPFHRNRLGIVPILIDADMDRRDYRQHEPCCQKIVDRLNEHRKLLLITKRCGSNALAPPRPCCPRRNAAARSSETPMKINSAASPAPLVSGIPQRSSI
jgi:hypothetical protein